jgi:hypothetical protein
MLTKTALIWDGKYDATGKRVAPLRGALPLQTVEIVNEVDCSSRHCRASAGN